MTQSALINIMKTAALKAAKPLMRDFNEISELQSSSKSPDGFMKVAQEKATKMIVDILSRARPDFGIKYYNKMILSTENDAGTYWFITPICGLENFRHAIPTWAIQISCIENGKAIAALTYDPVADELFNTDLGNGAYLNSNRIRTSRKKDLDSSILIGHLPVKDPKKATFDSDQTQRMALAKKQIAHRTLGCPALTYCYVAAGRFDAAFGHLQLKEMILNAALFTKESGGFEQNKLDDSTQYLLIGNDKILAELKPILSGS